MPHVRRAGHCAPSRRRAPSARPVRPERRGRRRSSSSINATVRRRRSCGECSHAMRPMRSTVVASSCSVTTTCFRSPCFGSSVSSAARSNSSSSPTSKSSARVHREGARGSAVSLRLRGVGCSACASRLLRHRRHRPAYTAAGGRLFLQRSVGEPRRPRFSDLLLLRLAPTRRAGSSSSAQSSNSVSRSVRSTCDFNDYVGAGALGGTSPPVPSGRPRPGPPSGRLLGSTPGRKVTRRQPVARERAVPLGTPSRNPSRSFLTLGGA